MTKIERTKALIDYYRSLNPAATTEWQILKDITKDLNEYLEIHPYEDLQKETVKRYESDVLYNEIY